MVAPAGSEEEAGTHIVGAATADVQWLRERKLDYLRYATRELHPDNPVNVLSHLARRRLEPGYSAPAELTAQAWDGSLADLAALHDGRDFQALYMLNAVFVFEDDPWLGPDLRARVGAALASFKFWYTEPTPGSKVDHSYYWSENHQVIFHTIEHLVGACWPARALGADGATGREHAERARTRLLRWMNHRLRFGFSEWHSNVYYQKDAVALLTLIELTHDEELRTRASMVLDVLLVDLALHTFRDAFGVTHGRSYKKDKMSSTDEGTWSLAKLLFGASTYAYAADDPGATIFATSTRYVLPEIVRRAAADARAIVNRERMGIPVPELGPVDAAVVAPFGLSYSDPEDAAVWWSMGAQTAWPVVPLTLRMMDQYGLWDAPQFKEFSGLRALSSSPEMAQQVSAGWAKMLNFGLLQEVETYTYRTADFMLSTAVDYRKGTFNEHLHAWQATFDARAIVFTNHPFRPLAAGDDWNDDPETGGYWNGEASAPRSAQVENLAIHIYAPQYAQRNGEPLEYFRYEPYTHAYFPQDYFDEVLQEGPWTFGRLGAAYVALYSYRPATYLVYDPATQATGGRVKPFDLRAEGGADNVWIVECGAESTSGSFSRFREAIGRAQVLVSRRGSERDTGESDGFDVGYESPTRGPITFGWEAPLVVRGAQVALRGERRYDSPYACAGIDPERFEIARDGFGVRLDVAKGRRTLFGP